jgi:hypothetical protein
MAVGVQVSTLLPPAAGSGPEIDTRTLFLPGLTERGDSVNPIPIRSKSEAAALLGDHTTYDTLRDQIDAYFGEAGLFGGMVYAARLVGAGATKGTATLLDRAGTPVATLRIDAKDEGAWSSGLKYAVVDGSATNTFTIILTYRGQEVERFSNLASPAAAVTAMATSGFARAVDLVSASASPSNNPAVQAATALSAGTDDRASVTGSAMVAALSRFPIDLGPGRVAIPGQPHTVTAAGIAAHCAQSGGIRTGMVAPPAGTSVAAAGAAARTLRAAANTEFLGFEYPWIQVPDGAGGTRTISPEGWKAGLAARLNKTYQAPAGAQGISQWAVGVEKVLTSEEIDILDADAVNTIRQVNGTIRAYGWRSLSLNEADYRYLTARDLLNELSYRCRAALERFPHRTIDSKGHLFDEVTNELDAVVAPIAADGGLYAGPNDPGWKVDTGPSVNTPQSIARGEVRAELAVRISPVGGLVRLIIRKVALTAEL